MGYIYRYLTQNQAFFCHMKHYFDFSWIELDSNDSKSDSSFWYLIVKNVRINSFESGENDLFDTVHDYFKLSRDIPFNHRIKWDFDI